MVVARRRGVWTAVTAGVLSLAINLGGAAYITSLETGGAEDFQLILPEILVVLSAYFVAVFGVKPRRGGRCGLRLTWLIPVCILATMWGAWPVYAIVEHLDLGTPPSCRCGPWT